MKILYFSGTGNSYATAKLIAGREGVLINMGNSTLEKIADEYVGIVVPCYCADIPNKVREFLSKAVIESEYIFAIVTCGAKADNCFVSINNCIAKNGARLSYTKELVLPDSSIVFATKTDKAKQLLFTHKERVSAITKELSDKIITAPLKDKKTPTVYTNIMWKVFKGFYKLGDKKTNSRCIGCGRCVDYCSVNNISIKDGKAVFGNNCENCFACIHRCDKMAIEFGKIKVTNATRYIHPEYLEEIK